MNSRIRISLAAEPALLSVLFSGCSTEIFGPHFWHENFVEAIHRAVGYKLEEMQPGWARPKNLIGIEKLPNGLLPTATDSTKDANIPTRSIR